MIVSYVSAILSYLTLTVQFDLRSYMFEIECELCNVQMRSVLIFLQEIAAECGQDIAVIIGGDVELLV